MKPTRSKSRKALAIGAEQSNAAQQEDISEGQEPPRTQPANEEAVARMAEFERLPPNFKLPSIPSYDGRGDPEDHVHAFISAFRLYCIPDPVICRAFPVFLQGTTRKWFWGLEPKSISTLGELVERFLHRFVSSRPTTRTSAYLLNVQQNPGESLRSYVQRFNEESVQIPDPNEQVTIAAFTHGLVSGVFNTAIHKKYPRTLHELWSKPVSGAVRDGTKQSWKGTSQDVRPPDKRNSNLYCLYHRDIGHETEDCNDLKKEIENLIRQGHLKQFIRRGGGYGPNIAGVINTIAGGPTGGDSQNSRKRTDRQANPDPAESSSRLSEVITYGSSDPVSTASSSHEALVIELLTNNYIVKKVYIDPESSVDVMYLRTFESLKLARDRMTPVRTPLVGFGGHVVHPEGMVTLTVTVGCHPRCRTLPVNFVVVKADSPYNLLLGRPMLNALRAVYSTYHLSFKFPTPAVVAEVSSDVCAARECYLATLQAASPSTSSARSERGSDILSIDCIYPQQTVKLQRLETGDEVEDIPLDPVNPDQTIRVGICLPDSIKEGMVSLLREYRDVFAWAADEVEGVPHHLIIHELNVDPQARPVKQKRRHLGPERSQAVGEEVDKLLPAKIIREFQYPTWLSNPVMVKKDTGAWRMCVDFTDLNKACPKDCYPLPKVDTLVDSAMGYEVLCFLDAFKGYHQIGMSPEDQEKTAFYTDRDTYCYATMPFGLKNAGATYQRLVNQAFKSQIGRNVETYVDDILLKSQTTSSFLSDLREVFEVLRKTRMMLNPKKCVFGVTSGKFLGYLVSRRGIEANPDKVKAIQEMSPPRCIRDVQRLTGRLAALNRFLSQSASKALPFFKVLKKADGFSWTEKCQQAFEQLKEYLHHLPTLTSPRPGDKLFLYLSAAVEAISVVLIREEGVQMPVYYVSRVLRGLETRYTQAKKLVLALIHAARRLKPYFLAHHICLSTDQPLRQVLSRPEASGRLTKWAIELGEYDLSYEPRAAIKAQPLADFLAELTFDKVKEAIPAPAESQRWILHVDGSSNSEGSGAGLLLEDPQGEICSYALRFDFAASNNEAEYEAVIAGLQLARKLGAAHILVYSDSQLVVCQILGEYEAREEAMHRYLSKVLQLVTHFESFEIQRIPRSQNRRADALSRLASTSFSDLNKTVLVEVLAKPGYVGEVVCLIYPGDTWMGPLVRFLSRGELPEDRAESRKLQRKAARYALRGDLLYKRSYLDPWLRCITPEEGERILQDIHGGLCGAHVGYRMLVKKALLLGYFWPTMRVDAQVMVLSCPSCNFVYAVVAVDYFTKWVEAEPLRSITGAAVQKFFWKSVVCRFGLPRVIISDNGRQFADNPFKTWCQNLGIKQHFTSVGHPQANGHAENFNRTLRHGLKTRLHRVGSSWVEELPSVLWSYRTTPRSATQETPFSLTYGSEAVVPAEFITPSLRMAAYAAEVNEKERRVDLNLAEEKRDMAAAKVAIYKNILAG
ncbi:uncharacterized protein LOC113772850 [Coffea eugenioides]|uniref:uncharacterized protein LOC113772850 n=1 Tax=Coffea eugenioides TaxID=49369 RepID=UPI000F606B4B|nr:uncharacterized protein LOC113772850 [Coffea eugenioides]